MILKIEDINAYSKDIAVIENHCFKNPWTDEQIRSSDNTVFFLAKEENKPIGYAGMYTVLDEGYVTNIGVMPLHRRKGVGKKLLEALIEFSNDSNLAFLSLEVRPSNLPAIKLYESFGFVSEGLRKNFYSNPREDGLIMTRYFK